MTDEELVKHQHYLIKALLLKLGCETAITKEEYARALGMRLEMRVWEETTSLYLMETTTEKGEAKGGKQSPACGIKPLRQTQNSSAR
ncbi:MAG: hypothetical protein AB1631_31645 [Acidobacteriota bacterium]